MLMISLKKSSLEIEKCVSSIRLHLQYAFGLLSCPPHVTQKAGYIHKREQKGVRILASTSLSYIIFHHNTSHNFMKSWIVRFLCFIFLSSIYTLLWNRQKTIPNPDTLTKQNNPFSTDEGNIRMKRNPDPHHCNSGYHYPRRRWYP